MINQDTSYLLGMIVGKGQLIRTNEETKVIIEIPHKNLEIEGMNTQISIKSSLLDIHNRLKRLVGTDLEEDTKDKGKAYIFFSKSNEDFLIATLRDLLNNETSSKDFRIPKIIFESSNEIKKEFMRGLADVTAHIRKSNVAFQPKDKLTDGIRTYIEIPVNWGLVIDIANLLRDLDVTVQNINWAHPNFRDPKLSDYKKGKKANFREHQIKIFADEFEKIGFNIEHKNELLRKYSELNRQEWNKKWDLVAKRSKSDKAKQRALSMINHIEIGHHKYYWETKEMTKKKNAHPFESHESLPKNIRGKHFDSWKDLAKELGYHA